MRNMSIARHSTHLQQLASDGFATISHILTEVECDQLLSFSIGLSTDSAGSRCLLHKQWCRDLVARMRADDRLKAVLPENFVAIQCIYFEKSLSRNWLVPVHQDLSIPVAARVDHPALRGWSEKESALYVQPPAELLERLIAVRLHLDPCTAADGPLQFIAGSHTQGRIDAVQASEWRRTRPLVTCTLERGDALLMHPLTLHASSKASGTSLRRVLHFVFGPPMLPYGLQWQDPV